MKKMKLLIYQLNNREDTPPVMINHWTTKSNQNQITQIGDTFSLKKEDIKNYIDRVFERLIERYVKNYKIERKDITDKIMKNQNGEDGKEYVIEERNRIFHSMMSDFGSLMSD